MKKSGTANSLTSQARLTKKQQLCLSCLKCCGKVGVYTDPAIYELTEKDVISFYEARGASISRDGQHLFVLFDLPCPHLTKTGCDIYPKRPKICRIYSGLDEFGEECLWSTLSKKKSKNK